MSDRTVARLGGAAGLAYVVLVLGGNAAVSGGGPDFTAPAAEVGAYLVAHPPTTATYAGAFVELLGLLCFVAFVARLFTVLRRAEGDGEGAWLPVTALAAGLVAAAVKIGSAPAALVAFTRAGEGIEPQLGAALINMNDFAFILTLALYALMLAATGAAVLRTGVLPRWVGVTATALAPVLLVTVGGAGRIPPLALVLALLWIAATSVVLVRRAGAVPGHMRATAPSAAAA